MTSLENKICEILSKVERFCDCEQNKCLGKDKSINCKVHVARKIIELVKEDAAALSFKKNWNIPLN